MAIVSLSVKGALAYAFEKVASYVAENGIRQTVLDTLDFIKDARDTLTSMASPDEPALVRVRNEPPPKPAVS